jgi:hypothetical protein
MMGSEIFYSERVIVAREQWQDVIDPALLRGPSAKLAQLC